VVEQCREERGTGREQRREEREQRDVEKRWEENHMEKRGERTTWRRERGLERPVENVFFCGVLLGIF